MNSCLVAQLGRLRFLTLGVGLVSAPAMGMDVSLAFQLPKGMGVVQASFSGFDNDRDGVISSSVDEVSAAWSSLTGSWRKDNLDAVSNGFPGSIDIRYNYLDDPPGIGSAYPGEDFLGLRRFIVDIKSSGLNHVSSNAVTFRGDTRFGFFYAYGISWSNAYNAPSSYSYTFEGPDNAVRLFLSTTGSPFATTVPEPGAFWLLSAGMFLVLLRYGSRDGNLSWRTIGGLNSSS
jgi:hypothetical protein